MSTAPLRLLLLFVIGQILFINPSFGMEQDKKFKIGFEFQEANHLCSWAKDMIDIQKKPIFTVSKNGRKLWTLVIDWQDLEFVTEPFTNNEWSELEECIESIELACNILKILIEKYKKEVSFKKWIFGIDQEKYTKESKNIGRFKQALINANENARSKIQITINNIENLQGLEKQLKAKKFDIVINKEVFNGLLAS